MEIDNSFDVLESPAKRVKLSDDYLDTKLSDTVTLVLRNNEELSVERSVLSSYSTYFRVLFSSEFRDSHTPTHRCRLVSRLDLHHLLSIPRAFEQGIKPELKVQRAIELLEPAAYLQIDIALDYISDVICASLTHENIIKIFRLSLIYHTPLAFRVWRTMIRLFQTMVNTNAYLALNESELIGLLTDKHLNIRSSDEKSVVVNWIQHNSPLESDRILQFAQRNFARKPYPDGSAKYEVIRTRQPANAVVSFGGWASRGLAHHIEVFNSRCDRWQICKFDYDTPDIRRAYNGIELIDEKLVIFGGFSGRTQFQTTLVFDLRTRVWKNGMNMHEKRCYVTGTTVDDSAGKRLIYACGGMNGVSRLKSGEMYDHVANKWTEIADMRCLRSDGATVTINNRVVCVGGFDGRNVHSSGEIYDPVVDVWQPLAAPMRTRRTGCTAVSVTDNVCVVLGGFNGTKRLDTSEMYDMREGVWHQLPLMHTTRSNFGACRTDTYSIYVAGGFDGHATTKDNERLDLRTRRWQALPDLNEAKSALRLVQLSDHPFLDELFQIPEDVGIVKTW